MCLIALALAAHPRFPFIVLANRDEFHDRPSRASGFWPERPELLGGRDLRAGGTWMGLTRRGRFAALTNVRGPGSALPDAPSRGGLVAEYLLSDRTPERWLSGLNPPISAYAGCNLVFGDCTALSQVGNCGPLALTSLGSGVHALSNALMDTPWPKVLAIRAALGASLYSPDEPDPQALLALLGDRSPAPDAQLPDTGVGLDLERFLSPICVVGPRYGTRSSTLLMVDTRGRALWIEQIRDPSGEITDTRRFEFEMEAR